MKKYFEYFGLALIMVFSFYYTDKIANIVLNKNPLMVTIEKEKDNYNVKSVNAEVNGNFIVPGINGLEVNVKASFYQMQESRIFNAYFLVFNEILPDISLENNKDKIITKGNMKKKSVSLILEEENSLTEYLKNRNIKASLLINIDTYTKNNYFEIINNEVTNFKSLENMLNIAKENKHICLINDNNKDICLKNKNFLIKPGLILNSSNILEIKKNIDSGSIVLIKKNAKLEDLVLLLKEINYKDLKIVYLSELISEKHSK